MRRVQYFLRILLVVAISSAAALYFIWPDCFKLDKDLPFNREDWRQGSKSERGRMVHDLITSERLLGMECDDVVKLLGEPEHRDDHAVLYYSIDIGQRFGWDPWLYTLLISCGEDRTVKAADLRD